MMDEFKSRFVDALCRPDVVMGIEGVIEPLLDQHREEFTHIMNQMINPLTLALKKQKEDVNLNGAISTHQMGEQGHRLCFKESETADDLKHLSQPVLSTSGQEVSLPTMSDVQDSASSESEDDVCDFFKQLPANNVSSSIIYFRPVQEGSGFRLIPVSKFSESEAQSIHQMMPEGEDGRTDIPESEVQDEQHIQTIARERSLIEEYQDKSMSVSDTHIKIDLPPDTGVEELRLVRKAIQESVMEEHRNYWEQWFGETLFKMQHIRKKMQLKNDEPWESEARFKRNLLVGKNSKYRINPGTQTNNRRSWSLSILTDKAHIAIERPTHTRSNSLSKIYDMKEEYTHLVSMEHEVLQVRNVSLITHGPSRERTYWEQWLGESLFKMRQIQQMRLQVDDEPLESDEIFQLKLLHGIYPGTQKILKTSRSLSQLGLLENHHTRIRSSEHQEGLDPLKRSHSDACLNLREQNCKVAVADLALEATFPASAICQLGDDAIQYIKQQMIMLRLWTRANETSEVHLDELMHFFESDAAVINPFASSMNDDDPINNWKIIQEMFPDNLFLAGSRAEGLAVEDGWGYPEADHDMMTLICMNFEVTQRDFLRERCFLVYDSEGCAPSYCKLRVPRVLALGGDLVPLLVRSSRGTYIDTFRLLSSFASDMGDDMHDDAKPDSICGPAGHTRTGSIEYEYVPALVGSAPHPHMTQVFQQKDKTTCLPEEVVRAVSEMAMTIVLRGHRGSDSDDYNTEARLSFSLCEFKLLYDQPVVVKQGYIAFKYIINRFLFHCRSVLWENDDNSHIDSYHLKTVLLHNLEKKPTSLINSPFEYMMELLFDFDSFLKAEKLPHYFIDNCDLFEQITPFEFMIVRDEIRRVKSNPLSKIFSIPTEPKKTFGNIHPNELATAFLRVITQPANKWSRNHLRPFLHRLDAHRLQIYDKLVNSEKTKKVQTRPTLTMLVDKFDEAEQML